MTESDTPTGDARARLRERLRLWWHSTYDPDTGACDDGLDALLSHPEDVLAALAGALRVCGCTRTVAMPGECAPMPHCPTCHGTGTTAVGVAGILRALGMEQVEGAWLPRESWRPVWVERMENK